MALAAGSRVGAYEISAALGAGGRGEVYRALDTKLGREVALKITASGISDDADSASLVVVPAGTTERRVIVPGARAGRVLPSGHLIFARGRRREARRVDGLRSARAVVRQRRPHSRKVRGRR
jgi:serine/threonine protein kinase